jgi:integrase
MAPMPRKLPPYVTRQRLRNGNMVFYYRENHGPRIRLPAPNDPGFMAAYFKCLSGLPKKAASGPKDSLAWLIGRYKESAHWANLKPSTRKMRDNILKHVAEAAGNVPYLAIKRQNINEAIDRRLPNAGNSYRKVMSQLFKWALSVDLVEVNPVDGANRYKIKTDGFIPWTVDEVKRFHAHWPIGTRQRLAMDLALFTGLRRSDLVRVGRQHMANGVISIKTEKTGVTVHVPVFPILQRSIDAAPTSDLAFLATEKGTPFTSAASLGMWFGKACRAAKVPGRLHGLRKAGATIAAEHGATVHQLMAMYGWMKMDEAELYTREADRKRLSVAVAEQIADRFSPTYDPTPQPLLKSKDKK